jgi:hypothetical protein
VSTTNNRYHFFGHGKKQGGQSYHTVRSATSNMTQVELYITKVTFALAPNSSILCKPQVTAFEPVMLHHEPRHVRFAFSWYGNLSHFRYPFRASKCTSRPTWGVASKLRSFTPGPIQGISYREGCYLAMCCLPLYISNIHFILREWVHQLQRPGRGGIDRVYHGSALLEHRLAGKDERR